MFLIRLKILYYSFNQLQSEMVSLLILTLFRRALDALHQGKMFLHKPEQSYFYNRKYNYKQETRTYDMVNAERNSFPIPLKCEKDLGFLSTI